MSGTELLRLATEIHYKVGRITKKPYYAIANKLNWMPDFSCELGKYIGWFISLIFSIDGYGLGLFEARSARFY